MTGAYRGGINRKKWNIFESVFFILLVLISGYILLRSPLFEIQRIVVQGHKQLAAEQVRTVAGISAGLNIFKLDRAAAAANLKAIPLVKEAQVTRALPSTVLITITERSPVGLLPAENDFIEIDGEGIFLKYAGAGAPGIPIITGVDFRVPLPGGAVQADRLEDALLFINELPVETRHELSEVHVTPDGQIKIYTLDRIQCRFGEAVQAREKSLVFHNILQQLEKQGSRVEYIDLSCVESPVVKYQ